MKLRIYNEDTKIRLWLPTRMLLNPLTAKLAAAALAENLEKANLKHMDWLKLSTQEINLLFGAVLRCVHDFKGLVLVDVESSTGEIVKIVL